MGLISSSAIFGGYSPYKVCGSTLKVWATKGSSSIAELVQLGAVRTQVESEHRTSIWSKLEHLP